MCIIVTLIQVIFVILDLHTMRPNQVLWLQHQVGIDFGASTERLVQVCLLKIHLDKQKQKMCGLQ
jgi:hypothetical protein